MARQSLAVKYRPTTFDDVSEQGAVKLILTQQLKSNETVHAYLFCGGAGTGKTTCARIFANEINKHQGHPIELDAASNNSVDDIRELRQQAKTKSFDSEYKVFILDECHVLSSSAWQAMLKLIEEPPAKSIFILCTTDPQKIPKTILSRVQRYDFQRISHAGIVNRLKYIIDAENRDIMEEMGDQDSASDIEWAIEQGLPVIEYTDEAVDYIAKIADGGMRDAITLLDKCIAYNLELTLENVVRAVGATDYDVLFKLMHSMLESETANIINIIESLHSDGKDLKIFVKLLIDFMLDVLKYNILKEFSYIKIPSFYEDELARYRSYTIAIRNILASLLKLNADIKYDTNPKMLIEATLLVAIIGN